MGHLRRWRALFPRARAGRRTPRHLASVTLIALAATLGVVAPPQLPTASAAVSTDNACPPGETADAGFTDTSGSFTHVINCAWHWGITNGTSATHYSPSRSVTREQMAGFMSRLVLRSGGTLPSSPPDAFGDDSGSGFQLQINQLAAVGIVNGKRPGEFEPRSLVTRGEMAAFLVRTYDYRVGLADRPPLPAGPDAFSDDDGHPREPDIDKAADAGFATGNTDGTFRPGEPVRRDHMAAFVARVLDRLVRDGLATMPDPPQLAVPASFTLTGAGWGHGVGMSQYGAYGMASDGATATEILAHYFSGTALGLAPSEDPVVRVQVRDAVGSVTVRNSGGPARIWVENAGGATHVATVPNGTDMVLTPVSAGIRVSAGGQSWTTAGTSRRVYIEWASTSYYQPGNSIDVNVSVSGAYRYRHGRLEVRNIGSRVNVVNVLRLSDEYVYGIAEMPSSWPDAALRAQAVAARTYALTSMGSVKSGCDCHVYSDTRSQVFRGWTKENETTWGVRWRAAVDGTLASSGRGRIVTRNGQAVPTYYFSSSGGRTQNSEDVWVSALPHLRSVADPWSLGAQNPNRSWTTSVSQAAMANAFGLADVARVQVLSRTDGNGIRQVRATSSAGATATLTGEQFRTRLGLRSTWVSSIR